MYQIIEQIKQKAQGSTDFPFWMEVATQFGNLHSENARLHHQTNKLGEDILRLRAELALEGEAWGRDQQRLKDVEAENTRLRAELVAVQLLAQDSIADADRRRAENIWFKQAQDARDAEDELAIKTLKAQVETLRAELAHRDHMWKELADAMTELRKRFHVQSAELAELNADLVKAEFAQGYAEAERDRLRELLRECYGHWVRDADPRELKGLCNKIDAALKDGRVG